MNSFRRPPRARVCVTPVASLVAAFVMFTCTLGKQRAVQLCMLPDAQPASARALCRLFLRAPCAAVHGRGDRQQNDSRRLVAYCVFTISSDRSLWSLLCFHNKLCLPRLWNSKQRSAPRRRTELVTKPTLTTQFVWLCGGEGNSEKRYGSNQGFIVH